MNPCSRFNICNALWSNKKQIKRPKIEDTLREICECNRRHREATICEFLKGEPVNPSSTDPFDRQLTAVKPYFDYDKTVFPVPGDEESRAAIVRGECQRVKEAVECIIRGALPFSDAEFAVHVANRSGIVKKPEGDAFKVSQQCYFCRGFARFTWFRNHNIMHARVVSSAFVDIPASLRERSADGPPHAQAARVFLQRHERRGAATGSQGVRVFTEAGDRVVQEGTSAQMGTWGQRARQGSGRQSSRAGGLGGMGKQARCGEVEELRGAVRGG